MCSKIAAKLMNSSDESSMGSAVYFSRSVFTENLKKEHRQSEELQNQKTKRWGQNRLFLLGVAFEL